MSRACPRILAPHYNGRVSGTCVSEEGNAGDVGLRERGAARHFTSLQLAQLSTMLCLPALYPLATCREGTNEQPFIMGDSSDVFTAPAEQQQGGEEQNSFDFLVSGPAEEERERGLLGLPRERVQWYHTKLSRTGRSHSLASDNRCCPALPPLSLPPPSLCRMLAVQQPLQLQPPQVTFSDKPLLQPLLPLLLQPLPPPSQM